MALRKEMVQLLQEQTPRDPEELRKLLGRIDEALQRSRFALRRAHEGSTVLQLIGLRRELRKRRTALLDQLKQLDFGQGIGMR